VSVHPALSLFRSVTMPRIVRDDPRGIRAMKVTGRPENSILRLLGIFLLIPLLFAVGCTMAENPRADEATPGSTTALIFTGQPGPTSTVHSSIPQAAITTLASTGNTTPAPTATMAVAPVVAVNPAIQVSRVAQSSAMATTPTSDNYRQFSFTSNFSALVPHSVNNVITGISYLSLAAAVAGCGDTDPCWLIDTLPETWDSNPFATYAGPGVRVDLGVGRWVTNAEIILPNFTQIIGSGRAGHGDGAGTRIQAGPSFPPNTSVVLLGPAGTDFAVRVENMGIDCNGVAGATGIENASAEEESGPVHVLVAGCNAHGIYFHGNNAQNSEIYDVEVLPTGGTPTSATIPVDIDNVPGFRGIHGATVNYTGGPAVRTLLLAGSSGVYEDMNLENATNGIEVKTDAVEVRNIQDNSNVTNLITLDSGVQSFVGTTLVNSGTNVLSNLDNGNTYAQAFLPFYFYGIGATRSEFYSAGGAIVATDFTAKGVTATAVTATGPQSLAGTGACNSTANASGGSWAGRAQCTGATGNSTLVITPGSFAPNFWECSGSDATAGVPLAQTGFSATTCTLTGTVNTNDYVTFSAVAY